MTRARRPKTLGSVLVIAIIGLATDKLLLSHEPKSAEAAAASGEPVGDNAGSSSSSSKNDPSAAANDDFSLQAIMDHAAQPSSAGPQTDGGPLPDVFAARTRVAAARSRPTSEEEKEQKAEQMRNAFVARYTLRATVLGRAPIALVGDRSLHVGDSVAGFRLVEIRDREAEFLSEFGRITLKVPGPK
jgi:hypothetical protein